MAQAFGQGVLKLSFLGQDQSTLTDCSEVIPAAIPFTGGPALLPPGLTMNDIEQAVSLFQLIIDVAVLMIILNSAPLQPSHRSLPNPVPQLLYQPCTCSLLALCVLVADNVRNAAPRTMTLKHFARVLDRV